MASPIEQKIEELISNSTQDVYDAKRDLYPVLLEAILYGQQIKAEEVREMIDSAKFWTGEPRTEYQKGWHAASEIMKDRIDLSATSSEE